MHQLHESITEYFENPFFIGTVEDNNDSTHNYRIKVRIAGIHSDTITTEQLPWAAKVDSSFMGIGDNQALLHAVPEIGSQVLLIAIGNNINSLVYLGCLYKNTTQTPTDDDYLNDFGIYDKDGNYIKLDKIKKLLELIWQGTINIDKITEMNITVNGNVNLTAPTTNIKGNVIIDGTLDITKATTIGSTLDVTGITTAADFKTTVGTKLSTHIHMNTKPGDSTEFSGNPMPGS